MPGQAFHPGAFSARLLSGYELLLSLFHFQKPLHQGLAIRFRSIPAGIAVFFMRRGCFPLLGWIFRSSGAAPALLSFDGHSIFSAPNRWSGGGLAIKPLASWLSPQGSRSGLLSYPLYLPACLRFRPCFMLARIWLSAWGAAGGFRLFVRLASVGKLRKSNFSPPPSSEKSRIFEKKINFFLFSIISGIYHFRPSTEILGRGTCARPASHL